MEKLGNITLYNADCMEIMKGFKDKQFALAIIDPPYGIGADKAQNAAASQREKANGKSKAGRGWKAYKETDWDNEIPSAEYWQELMRVSKNQIVWGGNYFTEYLEPKMGWIVWNKMQRDFSLADGELAWTSFDKAMRIFDMSRGEALAKNNKTGGRFHPTQKPVALYKWLLNKYAKAGDTILDTHLGSGSSAIAAHDGGFEFTGIELDEEYYNSAKQRLILHQRQLNLF
jgi:site-specific DNA-methyltransferase (adenine-specific)